MKTSAHKQRGISLLGLIFTSVALILLTTLGMKVAPELLNFYTVKADIKATAEDPALRGASIQAVRAAYRKRISVSDVDVVTAEDLNISKDGDKIVIAFAYSRQIHLFGNVSLLLDFEGDSTQTSLFTR